MKRPLSIRFWLAPAIALAASPVHAQPDTNAVGQEQALAEQAQARVLTRDWDALRAQVGEQEITEPQKAIERYRAFFEARAAKNPAVAISISLAIARLYRIELRDKAKALQICDWTLQQYAAFPGELAPIQRERESLLKPQDAASVPAAVRIAAAAPDAQGNAQGSVPAAVRIAGATGAQAADPLAPVKIKIGAATSPFSPGATLPKPEAKQEAKPSTLNADALSVPQAIELLASMGETDPHAYLARSIIGRGADLLQQPRSIPIKARLWIGDVLAASGDERAPQVLESVLSELVPPVSGFSSQWLLFGGIERLAGFYSHQKQHGRAAATWLRVEPLLDKPNWMAPVSLLNAAAVWSAAGQEAKSRELLLKVPSYGVSWLPGLEKSDGEHAHAAAVQIIQSRAVLEQAQGVGGASALSLLSYAHLMASDWKAAADASGRALKYSQELPAEARAKARSAEALARAVAARTLQNPPAP